MSKLNQIQQELRAIDQARFQKLCDAYLQKHLGFTGVNSIGSAVGADKVTRGVPDTVFNCADGSYALAAYTTQKHGLVAKLRSDLDDCLDEKQTGFSHSHISEIIICHNRTISTPDELALLREGGHYGIKITVFGLERISFDLYNKYPFFAKEFLGVDVDTGQIIPPDRFVEEYQKNAFSTRLDTQFRFRETELETIADDLSRDDLIIITGAAGVGKTRLMLQVASRFQEQDDPSWQTWAILKRGVDLFQDLRGYFSPPGRYLILVDDANRLSGFDYVLQLLHGQDDSRRFKVIVTVRDYARDKIKSQIGAYGSSEEIHLEPLKDEEIRTLLSDEMGIKDYHYQKRIVDIAQGNPRIAMMAAKIALKEQNLSSIFDVSSLYEEYFRSVREELEQLGDSTTIKVAGIVSFLRAADRSNSLLMTYIDEAFGLSPAQFWRTVETLHESEILDLYEGEVAKFSDQVLATYLFYYAAFKAKAIDFSVLLDFFFPDHASLFADALNPVLNTLGAKIDADLKPHVDKKWRELQEAGDSDQLLKLLQLFFFVKETDAFRYVRDTIRQGQKEESTATTPDLAKRISNPWDPIISLLGQLRYSKNFTTAIDLALDLVAQCPSTAPNIVDLFLKTFGFRPESYLYGYDRQLEVVSRLWQRTKDAADLLWSRLFLAVAEHYLRTTFDYSEAKGKWTLSITQFRLVATPRLSMLRRELWQHLFVLAEGPDARGGFIDLLAKYSHSGYLVSDKQLIEQDAEQVLAFLSVFQAANIREAMVARDYLRFLDHEGIVTDPVIANRFVTDAIRLADLFIPGQSVRYAKDWKEFDQELTEKIKEYMRQLTLDDYPAFFEQCRQIYEATSQSEIWYFHHNILKAFSILADTSSEEFGPIVTMYLDMGNPLGLWGGSIVSKLVELYGTTRALALIRERTFLRQPEWLFNVFASAPPEERTEKILEELIRLFQAAPSNSIPHNLEFLEGYLPIDPMASNRVVSILLSRLEAEQNQTYALGLSLFFSTERVQANNMLYFFGGDLNLLKQAYLVGQMVRDHADYSGAVFNAILDLDRTFICDYLGLLISEAEATGKKWLSWHSTSRDLAFLWNRRDGDEIIRDAILYLFERQQSDGIYSVFYLPNLVGQNRFHHDEEVTPSEDLASRRIFTLGGLVKERAKDPDFMVFLFSAVGELSENERRALIELFLSVNRDIQVFERLSLEPSSRGWAGSAVPIFQKELEFIESLLPLVQGVDFLEHRFYLEKRIEGQQRMIEAEKKRDFMRDL